MSPLSKRFGMLSALINALIRKPETIKYPNGPLSLPDEYRGAIVMANPDDCSGCGLCVRDCPAEALQLIKESRTVFRLVHYPARCAYCGQCEDNCRRGAISHTNDLVGTTSQPDAWVVELKAQDDAPPDS